MSTVVLSLFGDEIIPEQINAVGKSRAARKPKSPKKEEIVLEEAEVEQEAVPAIEERSNPVEANAPVSEILDLVSEVKQELALLVEDTAPVIPGMVQAFAASSPVAVETAPQMEQEMVLPIVEVAPVETKVIPVFVEATPAEELTVPEREQEDILPVVEVAPIEIEAAPPLVEAQIEIVEEVLQAVVLPIVEIAPQAIEVAPILEAPRTVETIAKPAVKKSKPAAKKKVAAKKEIVKREKPEGVAILEGWTPDKQYYSIGEVASLFYVATSHIRFWTNEFALKVRTTRKGDRLYSPEQINELRTIYHLVKEKGYTIAGAKARLKEAKKTPVHTLDLKQSLLQLRNKLVDIKNQL